MTIADTLYDAVSDIRGYIEDGMEPYGGLAAEIIHVVMMMDSLREKIRRSLLKAPIFSSRCSLRRQPGPRSAAIRFFPGLRLSP
jgi:hypothetical protein